jgi:hypothetical protein
MKVFLLKAALFLFGFWALSYSLGSWVETEAPMNVYSRSEAAKIAALMEIKDEVRAVSLGNSHSGAIDFATLGAPGMVLARAGTDLFEVNRYAESIAPLLPRLETVFISVSYFSFTNNNTLMEDKRNLRIELYAMLPAWKPLPGDLEPFILGKLHRYFRIMSIVRPDSWQNVFEQALDGRPFVEEGPAYSVTTATAWGECAHFTPAQLDAIGYEIGYKAANTHNRFLHSDARIPEQSYRALAQTIEMLQARGVRVVLFTPPYHQSYNRRFAETAPEMVEAMRASVAQLVDEYGVEYYDASSLEQFSTRHELFYNSDHLNECGSRAFTEYLIQQMDQR